MLENSINDVGNTDKSAIMQGNIPIANQKRF